MKKVTGFKYCPGEGCDVEFARYAEGGVAIRLSHRGEPQATASINMVHYGSRTLLADEVWLKGWDENLGVPEALERAGVVILTGEVLGFNGIQAQLGRLTPEAMAAAGIEPPKGKVRGSRACTPEETAVITAAAKAYKEAIMPTVVAIYGNLEEWGEDELGSMLAGTMLAGVLQAVPGSLPSIFHGAGVGLVGATAAMPAEARAALFKCFEGGVAAAVGLCPPPKAQPPKRGMN